MRARRLLALLALLAMVLAACSPADSGSTTTTEAAPDTTEAGPEATTTEGPAPEAPATIKIGAVVPITGAFAGGGAQVERGYRYAVEAINEAGGVFVEEYGVSIPLEILLRDDESTPALTVSSMAELAGEGIVAYLGGFGSLLHANAIPEAERVQIPYLGVATAQQSLHEQGYEFFFSPFPKSPDIAVSVFEMLNALIPEGERPLKVGIFQEQTDWGAELGPLWAEQAAEFGYEVVFHETYAVGTTDFTDLILGAQEAGVQAALSLPVPPDGIALYSQMSELGFKPDFNLVVRAADVPTWPDSGPSGEGVLLSAGWHPDLGYEGIEAIDTRHMEEEGRRADPIVGGSYALIQILADAIERAGTLDPVAVRDAIAATDMETVVGPITFREDGTAPISNPLMQRVGTEIKLIWPQGSATSELWYPATGEPPAG
ncbi:MAG TPA: amino acid ABC transporter substrate-binding protein [Acidimicrobiia bacterium]